MRPARLRRRIAICFPPGDLPVKPWLAASLLLPALWAQAWKVRIEEPTGLYRRVGEVVSAPLPAAGGRASGFTVTGPGGREAPYQVAPGGILFPVSVMPGELPEYSISCCAHDIREFPNPITARKVGLRRIEFGNEFFRAVIDTSQAAFVEVYSLRAAAHRALNLVETTPESRAALAGDIHGATAEAGAVIPPPVPGVKGENAGWTSLGASGPFDRAGILESGPLRGRIVLSRPGESWEITWLAGSPAFRWKARKGFRFASVSASPYVPFDRCADGSEYRWPTGPGEGGPPESAVGPRGWKKLPGGHMVYYHNTENYGALGIVALDQELDWTGACSRRFTSSKAEGDTEIAVTFPTWKGRETVLEARREFRILHQPLLVRVSGPVPEAAAPAAAAPRRAQPRIRDAPPTAFHRQTLSLDGEWALMWAEKGAGPPSKGWRAVRVPGTAHVQWLNPEEIYTRAAEWVSLKEWWYKKQFRVPAQFRTKCLFLRFEATDYDADVYLNGRFLARHEGYIDPWEVDITPQANATRENELLVRTWTPVHYYWKHRPYTVKGAYGAVDQKPDDITALGITRPVKLIASEKARIGEVAVNTRLAEHGAVVEVDLEARGAGPAYQWEATLSARNFSSHQRIQMRSAAGRRLLIPVPNPRLWWTWDHGKPNLYTLDIRLLDEGGRAVDGCSLPVGIREIEKIGWTFYLNRKKLFIRGTNYYDHLFLSEMSRASYERDFSLMLGMNVNMIRLHGHFSNPEFYALADERGVLIWQDFLEAWFPHDADFAYRASVLYDNHIRYVRNHPSVALWTTCDEEDLENYRVLTKHLAARPFFLDPQRRPVVRSTGRFGDSHVYYGWYGGSIWQYGKMEDAFVSELGATALPTYETLSKVMDGKWPFTQFREEWEWRRLQVPEALRAWGDPAGQTLKDFIPRTQAYAARLFQIALERMRRRKAEGAGGILHFHAIDIWPSVTMAAVDFERRPTKVYDTVRRSFAPVAALFEYSRDHWKSGEAFECRLWAVNDLWEPLPQARLRWRIVGPAGQEAARGEFPVSVLADSVVPVGLCAWTAGSPGAYQVRAEILRGSGEVVSENIFEFEVIGP